MPQPGPTLTRFVNPKSSGSILRELLASAEVLETEIATFGKIMARLPTDSESETSDIGDAPRAGSAVRAEQASLTSALYSEIIHIDVGNDPKVRFSVHKGLLCGISSYFRAALCGSFKEAEDAVVCLETESVKVFRSFVTWLYTRRLLEQTSPDVEIEMRSRNLVELYLFADRRRIPCLKNRIIDCIGFHEHEIVPIVNTVYEHTTELDGLRKLMVSLVTDQFDCWAGVINDPKCTERLPKQFFVDIAREMMKDRMSHQGSGPEAINELKDCLFHEHSAGMKCSPKALAGPQLSPFSEWEIPYVEEKPTVKPKSTCRKRLRRSRS